MSPTTLFTYLKIILLQCFQQNKLYPNGPLVCVWQKLFLPLILLFNLFLLLFMGPTALFGTIHGSHCIIATNYSTFSKKKFSFNKISGSQTNLNQS